MTEFEKKLLLLLAEIAENLDFIAQELNSLRNKK
jgi:hypothetical protein